MEATLQSESTIRIHAPRDKVWEAITRPEIVKRYFFDADLKADWRVGGEVVYRGFWDGDAFEDVAEISEYEEGYSVTMDFHEKYGRVTYTLVDQSEPRILNLSMHEFTTEVTVIQSGMGTQEEVKQTHENWMETLKRMKQILE